jgi:hypothetical protein
VSGAEVGAGVGGLWGGGGCGRINELGGGGGWGAGGGGMGVGRVGWGVHCSGLCFKGSLVQLVWRRAPERRVAGPSPTEGPQGAGSLDAGAGMVGTWPSCTGLQAEA